MKTDKLKKRIREKFKKYVNFSKAAKVDMYSMNIEFLRKKEVSKQVYDKYEFLCDLTEVDNLLTQSMRGLIYDTIQEKGGLFQFSRDSGIPKDTISQVIAGKYKLITPAVKRIMDALKIGHEAD